MHGFRQSYPGRRVPVRQGAGGGWRKTGFGKVVKTYLDKALMDEPLLGVGTGKWGNEILITPQNLVTASNAIVVNLTVRES